MTNETHSTPVAAPGQIMGGYSMDYSFQIEYAQRADGQWFSRLQYKDPRYGYKWSSWTRGKGPGDRFVSPTGRKARLPRH